MKIKGHIMHPVREKFDTIGVAPTNIESTWEAVISFKLLFVPIRQ